MPNSDSSGGGGEGTPILKPIRSGTKKPKPRTKVTIIGTNAIGMAAAFALIEMAGEICLFDTAEDKVKGEVLDLQHGQQFLRGCHIHGGTNYAMTANSDVVLITAMAKPEDSKLKFVQQTVDIWKKIIPEVVKNSPNCILVVMSNPVDILTYAVAKLSGLPHHRVIGTGTMLDSSRFRYLLGERLGVPASSVHGYVIGEHGETSVPVWSTVNIAGVSLSSINPKAGTPGDPDKFDEIYQRVVQSEQEVAKLKGDASWSTGLTCLTLCNAILNNIPAIHTLSTLAKDFHGIQDDVYLSLPCLVNAVGISHVIPQKLNDEETKKLQQTAKRLTEFINGIKW